MYLFAQSQLVYIWGKATPEAKVIIVFLAIFSIAAWSVMSSKVLQMRRAKKLNQYFDTEFRGQQNVLGIFDRKISVDGCPMFAVYNEGCTELDARLKNPHDESRKEMVSLKSMEHIKRTLEGSVARES